MKLLKDIIIYCIIIMNNSRSKYGKTYKNNYSKYKKSYTTSKTFNKAVKRIVKKEVQSEMKFHTSVVTATPVNAMTNGTTPVFYDLTAVPQGVTDSNRIGDDLKIKSLSVKLSIAADSGFVQGTARVIIFQWKNDSSLIGPSTPQILMTGISGTQDAYSFWNEDQKTAGTFTVLYDRIMPVVNNALGAGGGDQISRDIKVPLKWARKDINFTAGNADGRNHIYMLLIADRVVGAGTDRITYAYNSRMYFTDS